MSSIFDRSIAAMDESIGAMFGQAVEYTFLSGRKVTDRRANVDNIPSGYEVDEGIRTSQDNRDGNREGIDYQNRRTFGFRKSVIGQDKPEIYAKVRVVSEGPKADVWTVWRVIGSEAARWYVECEQVEAHEVSRPGLRK